MLFPVVLLNTYLAPSGALESPRFCPHPLAVNIVCQVLDALEHIHAHSILHRDIKPSNVMVKKRPNGTYVAKLMDFGIAAPERLNQATQITMLATAAPGSPAYMAPERIDSDTFGQPCPATDLYAVGVMLYEMVCGHLPFQGTLTEVLAAQLSKPANFDALPTAYPELRNVIRKALSKKIADRYSNAAEMKAALGAIQELNGEAAPAPEEFDTTATVLVGDARHSSNMREAVQEAVAQAHARLRRRRWLKIGSIVVLLGAGCFLLKTWLVPDQKRDESTIHSQEQEKDRAQKCESDDFWRYEQLCHDYPGWSERMDECVSHDFWKHKEKCSTYPRWREMYDQCNSKKCVEYPFCHSYPKCTKPIPSECLQGEYWEQGERCGVYPEWKSKIEELCQSPDCGKYRVCASSPKCSNRPKLPIPPQTETLPPEPVVVPPPKQASRHSSSQRPPKQDYGRPQPEAAKRARSQSSQKLEKGGESQKTAKQISKSSSQKSKVTKQGSKGTVSRRPPISQPAGQFGRMPSSSPRID